MLMKNFSGGQQPRPDWQKELGLEELIKLDRLCGDAVLNHHDEAKVKAWNDYSDSLIARHRSFAQYRKSKET